MTKLTTERLEKKIKSCIEIENCEVMMPLSAAQELLAFRNAAKNPIAWVVGDEEIADFKNDREVCVMRDCDDEQLDYLPLYAAPVLPKQPEHSRQHFESLCNQFWNWAELDEIDQDEEPRLEWNGSNYTHRVTAALWKMYQAAPAQPVIPRELRSFVTDADIAALHRFAECCDDPESGGHDLEKEQVQRLEKIGALQRSGRISYITDFGDYLISAAPAQESE